MTGKPTVGLLCQPISFQIDEISSQRRFFLIPRSFGN